MNPDFFKSLVEGASQAPKTPIEQIDGQALSSPVTQLDADTVKSGGESYRIQGFNAPETPKFQGGIFVPGQVAGDNTQEVVNTIARQGGFTNLEDTGKRDKYGRIIARQTNKAGESLGDLATALGITAPNLYTEDKVISDQRMTSALTRIMPRLAEADPIMKTAMEEHQRRVKEAGGNPLYIPKLTARDEEQYAAAKSIVGIQAVKENIEEIDRLEGILKDPSLRPELREKLDKQLIEARDKLFLAGTTPDFIGGVALRKGDRTIMNKSLNQFSTSFDNALLDMQKGLFGFGQMLGESQKWEWLAEKSNQEVLALKQMQSDLPATLSSIREVPGKDSWQTIENAATYAGNLFAGTLPMMAALVASTVATGGIGTPLIAGMAATVPGAVLYSGQFYADQENKNAALALSAGIAAATLDKIGLEGLLGANIFSKVGRQEVLSTMMQSGKYASVQEAEEVLKSATKSTLVELSGAGAEFATRHYASKEARAAALKAIGVGTGGETVTETGQTFLELMARSGELNTDFTYEKHFYSSLIDAAIGGGLMGGAFTAGGTALDMAGWHSVADAKRVYEGNLTDAQAYQAEQREKLAAGDPRAAVSTLDAIAKINLQETSEPAPPLESLAGKSGVWNGFLSILKDPVRMLRGLADTTVRSLRNPDGSLKTYLPILKSIMAPGVLTGDHYDGFRQRIIGEFHTTDAETLATQLKTSPPVVSRMLKEAWQSVWQEGGRLDTSTPEGALLQNWKDEADQITSQAMMLMADMGFDISQYGSLDAVFEDASIDPQVIARNSSRIINTMVRNGSKQREAQEAVEALVSGNPSTALSAKNWMMRYGVFKDPTLNDLFEPNIFGAFENFKHRVATAAAQDLYLGRDGSNLSKLLQLAKENGEFESEDAYLDTVQNTKDFYKIATGRYNSLENYPFIEKVLGWGVTLTMLASLGKATISSIPEAALSTLGTPGKKVVPQLMRTVEEFARGLKDDFNKGVSWSTSYIGISYARNSPNGRIREQAMELEREIEAAGENPSVEKAAELAAKVKRLHKKSMGRSLFEKLGYNDSGYNTQAKFETTTANMKASMQVFSSLIGLRAITDATRIATLSMAADIMRVRLAGLQAIPAGDRNRRFSNGEDLSNEQYQSLKELQKYGMDVIAVLDIMDRLVIPTGSDNVESLIGRIAAPSSDYLGRDNPEQILRENLQTTLRNMVDARIVNPQVGNLPKYYYDPKLRIFTAMTRFIAGLTANILPRLYMDYVKNGSAGMRYQAFATMMMAVAFAHFANILKDMLAYGDDENPYLKGKVKAAQRAVYGSGLLGRVEGMIDTVAPLYPTKTPSVTKDPFGAAYSAFKGNAPPVSWADRAVRAMYQLSTGETEQGVKNAVRSMPLVGSFPVAAQTAAQMVDKE